MTTSLSIPFDEPLIISRSRITTEVNKTGTWRFVRPVFQEKTAPCSASCPAGEDIPRIEMLAAEGRMDTALETILMENPFPSVCGRVCFHPCEKACNRAELDQPVAIHQMERFIGDHGLAKSVKPLRPASGRRVAIIGAGPAGLAAAYFLARLGHACDVFESRSEPGGLLRWGIPAYRLPTDILAGEIERINSLGVTIRCNQNISPEFFEKAKSKHSVHPELVEGSSEKLNILRQAQDERQKKLNVRWENGYDAFFIGTGFSRPIGLRIPGEDLALDGLAFLEQVRRGEAGKMTGPVAVIGGGNTAVDVARSLLRLGAEPAIVYRRRREDMPAFGDEIRMAIEEGARFMELVAPAHIERSGNGCLLIMQPMMISGVAKDGRAQVTASDEKPVNLTVSAVFKAIGAGPEAEWEQAGKDGDHRLTLSHCAILDVATTPIIYGGDLATAINSITHAIASGKQAALALDLLFSGASTRDIPARLDACRIGNGETLSFEIYTGGNRGLRHSHIVTAGEIVLDAFARQPRTLPVIKTVRERSADFTEVEATYNAEAAGTESARCFNCGICNECDTCRVFCPEMSVRIEPEKRHIHLDYCKGCGICVTECPRNAMALEEEAE